MHLRHTHTHTVLGCGVQACELAVATGETYTGTRMCTTKCHTCTHRSTGTRITGVGQTACIPQVHPFTAPVRHHSNVCVCLCVCVYCVSPCRCSAGRALVGLRAPRLAWPVRLPAAVCSRPLLSTLTPQQSPPLSYGHCWAHGEGFFDTFTCTLASHQIAHEHGVCTPSVVWALLGTWYVATQCLCTPGMASETLGTYVCCAGRQLSDSRNHLHAHMYRTYEHAITLYAACLRMFARVPV